MPELDDRDNDDLMNAVFADVRQEVAGFIRPAGAASAVATVKRRRRNRAVAGAALAVALIVGPVIGIAWAQSRPDRAPDVADVTPSVSASEPPPSTPSAGPSGSGSPSLLDPGIPMSQLRNSTLPVPRWPATPGDSCASGPVTFTDGKADGRAGGAVALRLAGDPVHVDVDGDGRNETVIRVDCALQGVFTQVVAYSRGADGKISTRGRVVATAVEGSDVQLVHQIGAGGPGTVRVDVGDVNPCCGLPADLPQHQWRTYGWNGQTFRQTGGPTKFPINPKTADLATSARTMVVSAAGTTWVGPMVATVTNNGPNVVGRLDVGLTFPVEVTISGADAARCALPAVRSMSFTCRFDRLAAGSARTLRLDVTAYGDPRGQSARVTALNGADQDDDYPDLNRDDNAADVPVT